MSDHAIENARGHLAEIVAESKAIEADSDATDEHGESLLECWQCRPLDVSVRTDWYNPYDPNQTPTPAEYQILLTTGGPGLRIYGELADGEPQTAFLEWQDWAVPWTRLEASDEEQAALLHFAQQFPIT